jgi:hypothetical protein
VSGRTPWVVLVEVDKVRADEKTAALPRPAEQPVHCGAGRAFVVAGVAAPLAVAATATIPKDSASDASVVATTFGAFV